MNDDFTTMKTSEFYVLKAKVATLEAETKEYHERNDFLKDQVCDIDGRCKTLEGRNTKLREENAEIRAVAARAALAKHDAKKGRDLTDEDEEKELPQGNCWTGTCDCHEKYKASQKRKGEEAGK